jgi:FKBP12-rapamycin complex-associated protein
MKETFLDTADQILGFRSSRDNLVKKMVITLIPTLAAYDTQTFAEHFLHKAMAHLLTQLEKPNERSFGGCLAVHSLCLISAHAASTQLSLQLVIQPPLSEAT